MKLAKTLMFKYFQGNQDQGKQSDSTILNFKSLKYHSELLYSSLKTLHTL